VKSGRHSSDIGLIVGLVAGLLLAAVLSGVIVYLWMRHRNAPRARSGPGPLSSEPPSSPGPTDALMVESYIVDRPIEDFPADASGPSNATPITPTPSPNTNRYSKTSNGLMMSPSSNPNSELAALYQRSGRNTEVPTLESNVRLTTAQLDIVAKLLERGMPTEDISTIVQSMASPAPPALSTVDERIHSGPPSYGGHTTHPDVR
jgi:hypothetical protein